MSNCGVFTGILFSRKPCGDQAAVHCGYCKIPLCTAHLRPQASGPFLCPNCDAYEQDEEWDYSEEDQRWRHHTGSSSRGELANDLADEDKAGFAAAGAAVKGLGDDDEENADEQSGFDAS